MAIYSLDYRSRVLEFIKEGKSKDLAAKIFKVSIDTIYRWIKLKNETGSISDLRRKQRKTSKFNDKELILFLQKNSDAFLSEIGQAFGGTDVGALKALRRIGYTRKKKLLNIRKEKLNKEMPLFGRSPR